MKAVHSDMSAPETVDSNWRIGMVGAMYHRPQVEAMMQAAEEAFAASDITSVDRFEVLGSFEIPLIGSHLAVSDRFDALIGFGVVLEGETNHADLITREVARGLMDIQIQQGIPFAFEVLQVKSLAVADERCFGEHSKGKEAAIAVLHSLAELAKLGS